MPNGETSVSEAYNSDGLNDLENCDNEPLFEDLGSYNPDDIEPDKLLDESSLLSIQCGLENMGNTCYFNVILQVLAHTPVLNDWILKKNHRETFLFISLKRFKENGEGKLHSAIKYEELLKLDEWLSKDCLNTISDKETIYHLFAVVIHSGNNMTNGHYICYVKDEFTNNWYEANDKLFTKVDFKFDKAESVYLLCYERSDLNKTITLDSMNEKHISTMSINIPHKPSITGEYK
ncbi:unnamed protein product [Rotaria sp. Silwood1]|nr:unnamed protein product [Rotaria sp. Silwood1]